MKLLKLPSGSTLNFDQACTFGKHGLDGSLQITFVGQAVVLHGDDAKAVRLYLDEHADMLSATPRAGSLAEVLG
jgi:hypothetical protein